MAISQPKKGVPRKMASEKRRNIIKVGLSDHELKIIKALAKRTGVGLATLLRTAALEKSAKGE
jgi:hypothetical protein